jgi:hypothetical protein
VKRSEHRTVWIFRDDGHWYEVGVPYSDEFAAALGRCQPKAWQVALNAIEKLIAAVDQS